MADRTIRIGKVSSVDYGSGMIKVTYPDLDNSVTDDLPYLTFNDEYKMPKVGASVLVVHLSNGSAMGIVAGTYWNSSHRPPVSGKGVYRKDLAQAIGEAFLQYSGSSLQIHAPAITLDASRITLATKSGSITVAEIINHIKDRRYSDGDIQSHSEVRAPREKQTERNHHDSNAIRNHGIRRWEKARRMVPRKIQRKMGLVLWPIPENGRREKEDRGQHRGQEETGQKAQDEKS